MFVDYTNLIEDWRREVKRISATLAINLDARDEHAIEEFLTPDLRHHRHSGPVPEPFGGDWISAVYEALRAAARDEPWDESTLDRVFEAIGRANTVSGLRLRIPAATARSTGSCGRPP